MKILNRLERALGRYAIRELMVYIVGINALVYMLRFAYPQSGAMGKLWLDPQLIMQGEVWRLVTWIFIPPAASIFWIFFILYFYYIVGTGLEHEWGSFRFNVYYFTGIFATALAAFIVGDGATALYLNLSLFLAFAYIYPDYEILIFFVFPVKVKYLAWLNWLFLAFTVLTAPLAHKAAALVSVSNYFLFFGSDIIATARRRGSSYNRRRPFKAAKKTTMHKCTVCQITEADNPQMDFRYCSTCEGDFEYCMDHLKAHEHVKKSIKDGE
ncbi:MAG: rhomboid family intramembrane serine protease [Nitrospirae bacterium]|nr:rhomboid family intramembrane serine protease [Nitrospirota bacterium]